MTELDLRVETTASIRAIYPDAYDVSRVGEHFTSLNSAWTRSLLIAYFRSSRAAPTAHRVFAEGDLRPSLGQPSWLWAQERYASLTPSERTLAIRRLRLGSPLDLTLAVQGGVTAVSVYAVHLLARIMRDPERVGAWLPRLIAGWHKGMSEVTRARSEREILHSPPVAGAPSEGTAVKQILATANALSSMKPAEVIVEGAGEVPRDLREATGS